MEQKKVNTSLLLKSGFWYTVSSYLTRAMVFITMPIFARLMSKSEYGDFSVYANWQQILLIICGLEVYSALNRARFDFPEKKDLDGYITSSLVLCTLVTAVVFVLYLIVPNVFDRLFLIDRKYMYIMFAYLFTYPAFMMFQAKQRIEYRYKLNAAISFALTILSSILAVILVFVMKSDRLYGRIIGQFVLSIAVGIIFYLYFVKVSHTVSKKYFKYALRIGLPMVFSYLASRVLLASDTFVLKHMCTAEEVSYLSVTHTSSHILILLVQTINGAWAPWFYDMLAAKDYPTIKKAFSYYLWGSIALTACILLIGPELILVLGGSKYKEAVYILPAYTLGGVFTVLTAQFGSLETYYKKPEYAAVLTAITAALNVGLDILGVKIWGYQAVVYATLICQVLLVIAHYIITGKMQVKETLTPGNLTRAMLVSILLVPISLLLYESNVIRYIANALIGITVVVLTIKYKENIHNLLKKIKNR